MTHDRLNASSRSAVSAAAPSGIPQYFRDEMGRDVGRGLWTDFARDLTLKRPVRDGDWLLGVAACTLPMRFATAWGEAGSRPAASWPAPAANGGRDPRARGRRLLRFAGLPFVRDAWHADGGARCVRGGTNTAVMNKVAACAHAVSRARQPVLRLGAIQVCNPVERVQRNWLAGPDVAESADPLHGVIREFAAGMAAVCAHGCRTDHDGEPLQSLMPSRRPNLVRAVGRVRPMLRSAGLSPTKVRAEDALRSSSWSSAVEQRPRKIAISVDQSARHGLAEWLALPR
jgi:hypothetical protein